MCFPCTWSTRPDPACQLEPRLEGGIHSLKFIVASLRTYSKQIVNILFLSFSFCHPPLPLTFLPTISCFCCLPQVFPHILLSQQRQGLSLWSSGSAPAAQRICSSKTRPSLAVRSRDRYQVTWAQQELGTEHRACQASSSEQMKSSKLLMQFHQFPRLY